MANSFLFDMNKCTGCGACRLACTIENRLDLDKSWRRVDTFNDRHLPLAPLFHHSTACNHCLDAPCKKACPARAIRRDEATGAVIIDDGLCIGCKYCSWACPYEAPRFDGKNGVMGKCTLCSHLLEEGKEPACTSQCPTGALRFGEVKEEELFHEVTGYPQTGIKPQVKIEALRGENPVPELTAPAEVEFFDPIRDLPPSKISLQTEWSLVVFTFLAALGVALVYASLSQSVPVNGVAFTIAAAAALGLSVVHLGRKERAPRAMLNLTGSWLSREILLTSLFAGLSALYLLFLPPGHTLGWIAVIVGFMALYSIDWVYSVTMNIGPGGLHSAGALLTGLFFTSVFIDSTTLILVFGALKFFFYVKRKLHFVKTGRGTLPLVSALRLTFGFLIPAIIWADSPEAVGFAVMFIYAGELIDRCEYYDELEVLTPLRKMAADLKAMLPDQKKP